MMHPDLEIHKSIVIRIVDRNGNKVDVLLDVDQCGILAETDSDRTFSMERQYGGKAALIRWTTLRSN